MPAPPIELTLGIRPRARFDVVDVRHLAKSLHGDVLEAYPHCLYASFHTTAGYLDQSLASRLARRRRGVTGYVQAFRTLFPEDAGYRHDALDERHELSHDEKKVEPRNADSHLAFMAAGLSTCVTYRNRPHASVDFVDLDGMNGDRPRQRTTTIVGYRQEVEVARLRIDVPVSGHPVDSINLKDARLGVYEQLAELIARQGVVKGRIQLSLCPRERSAGLTVNEYETLLMQHDLMEVVRDPLRFMAEKSRSMLANPRGVPGRTLDYAKYDLVRAFNHVVDALGLSESMLEKVLSKAIAVPAARFLRMKRGVNLLVSDRQAEGHGRIVEGTYQSTILVQWRPSTTRMRHVDAVLYAFQ
ncbi:MAG: hypothetical protein MUF60_02865 [Vicinamibacterales bacterium]|nr:hypothetical protein [Vicinamibacterales bacterium]